MIRDWWINYAWITQQPHIIIVNMYHECPIQKFVGPMRSVIECILVALLALDLARDLFELQNIFSQTGRVHSEHHVPCQSRPNTAQCVSSPSPIPPPKSPTEAQTEYCDGINTSKPNTSKPHSHVDMCRLGEHAPTLQQQTKLPRCMTLLTRRLVDHDCVQQPPAANLFDQGRLGLERVHTVAENTPEALRVYGQFLLLNHIQSRHGNSTSKRVPNKADLKTASLFSWRTTLTLRMCSHAVQVRCNP